MALGNSTFKQVTADQPVEEQAKKIYARLSNGLVDGVTYKYQASGLVNWRAMIDPTYIVFNRKFDNEFLALYGKPSAELIYSEVIKTHTVDDRHVLIQLAGFIELAELRGYVSSTPTIAHVTPGLNVTTTHLIEWVPNLEEPHGKTSSGSADATFENTGGFEYLAAVADNRAFVRAVRRGLRIHILGLDEISKKDDQIPTVSKSAGGALNLSSPQGTLESHARTCGLTFDQVKKRVFDENALFKVEGAVVEWTSFESIVPRDCMKIIGVLQSEKAAKEKK